MRRWVPALMVAAVMITGCTAGGPATPPPASAPPTSTPTATAPAPDATETTAADDPTATPAPATPTAGGSATATPGGPDSPSPEADPTPRRPAHPVSVQALIEKRYDGRNLRRGSLITDAGPYKRYRASFRGDGLTITGIMNVPDGRGPFPVVVLNHGYIDPDIYVRGQGMAREQDYLARRGFVVLHVDYRNHAGSGNDPNVDYELRLPYAVDTINAVKAVKSSRLRYIDTDKVAWMGRSMGGNVTLNALVAQPGLVDAAVLYASTSSLAADNWRQFYRNSPDRERVNRRIARGYGLPADSPAFWRRASPRPYFDRITEPVLIFHGGRDDTCPLSWSRATHRALREAGVDSRLVVYPQEGHRFEGQFYRSIRRAVTFLEGQLR